MALGQGVCGQGAWKRSWSVEDGWWSRSDALGGALIVPPAKGEESSSTRCGV
jgi:hypothetical protein